MSNTRPYRPCNSDEGAWFEGKFCDLCKRDAAYRRDPDHGDSCPILASVLALSIDDPNYPKEWVEDVDGKNPRCTAFEEEA
jgi:hypothetical protein